MILKSLREKSNQKHINKLLSSRESGADDSKIDTLGIILNSSEFIDFEAFRELASQLKINPNKTKIIAFTEDDKEVDGSREMLFSPKQIGWKTKIKNPELQDFLKKQFDALICFYNEENVILDLVTALSKAKFKIGTAKHDERLYDLIIETANQEFELFKTELV
ncbi:MAG: hypothetical protein EX254_08050, partial [Flavobacteriaceae bacterium]